ncbi:HugZ family protein [Celeribacter sp.]|uniref:HugZ family pyridoxamine 5'-phosphate oxidase n=1 Tax=Celeribacter sp. TaxID=1890673 RepID=UPI003A8DD3AE
MSHRMKLVRETPLEQNEVEPFGPRDLARRILRTTRQISLATLDRNKGFPYSAVTNLSVEPDGAIVFYGAAISHHSRNIMADPRVSVTLSQSEGRDVLRDRRMTLIGTAHRLDGIAFERAKNRYRRKFFRSSKYLDLADSCMFKLNVEAIHLNGGPARYSDSLSAEDLSVDLRGAEALLEQEDTLIAHFERFPNKIKMLTSHINGVRGRWHIATIDPEGMDLASETEFHRLSFSQRVTTPATLLGLLS